MRIRDTDPPTVKHSIAPQGFSVLYVHRDPTASYPAGGGLAVIYRDLLGVRPLPKREAMSTIVSAYLNVLALRPMPTRSCGKYEWTAFVDTT